MKKAIRQEVLLRVRTAGTIGLPKKTVSRMVRDAVPPASAGDVEDAIAFLLAKGFLAVKPSALDAGEERLILAAAGYDVVDSPDFGA